VDRFQIGRRWRFQETGQETHEDIHEVLGLEEPIRRERKERLRMGERTLVSGSKNRTLNLTVYRTGSVGPSHRFGPKGQFANTDANIMNYVDASERQIELRGEEGSLFCTMDELEDFLLAVGEQTATRRCMRSTVERLRKLVRRSY